MDMYKNKNIDLGTGYEICTNHYFRNLCGDNFYTIYHDIMYHEINKNNILGVNGLIRWIDMCGVFP